MSVNMSKLSFRAKALDAAKPLPVYILEDLPDNTEASISRAVPAMPTGMEKDEECVSFEEIHLASSYAVASGGHFCFRNMEARCKQMHVRDFSHVLGVPATI